MYVRIYVCIYIGVCVCLNACMYGCVLWCISVALRQRAWPLAEVQFQTVSISCLTAGEEPGTAHNNLAAANAESPADMLKT